MGSGESPDGVQPTIPAYMISTEDGIALREHTPSLNGASGTMGVPFYFVDTAIVNAQAGFSSQGPTDVDFRVKPDLMAPGGNVISSIPLSYCDGAPCFAFLSGTSMASPHLAGSAAVVRAHTRHGRPSRCAPPSRTRPHRGSWTQSGHPGVAETDVNIVGAGLADVDAALGAKVAIGPVSTSFGAVPSISGQVRSADVTLEEPFRRQRKLGHRHRRLRRAGRGHVHREHWPRRPCPRRLQDDRGDDDGRQGRKARRPPGLPHRERGKHGAGARRGVRLRQVATAAPGLRPASRSIAKAPGTAGGLPRLPESSGRVPADDRLGSSCCPSSRPMPSSSSRSIRS